MCDIDVVAPTNNQADLRTKYKKIVGDLLEMVLEKQKSYGNAVEKVPDLIRVLYPNGIPQAAYTESLMITRVCDKLMRIATAHNNGRIADSDAWSDILGYALIALSIDSGEENS